MKVRALKWAFALFPIALGIPQAFAQGHGAIEAKIPFAFNVGAKVLEPGDYIIDVAGNTGPSVLTIKEKESGKRVMLDTDQLPEKDDPKAITLVFDKIGDQFYLMEVWGVENSGRGVKHMVDGEMVKRATEESRQRITAIRIESREDQKSGG